MLQKTVPSNNLHKMRYWAGANPFRFDESITEQRYLEFFKNRFIPEVATPYRKFQQDDALPQYLA